MAHKQKGAALVEFALILPLLLALTFITTEYARAIFQYNSLTKSVRNAARYLSTQGSTFNSTTADIAKNIAVYGRPAASGTPLAPGLDKATHIPDSNIIYNNAGAAPTVRIVTVRISGYRFRSMFGGGFGLTFSLPLGDINFENIQATMRVIS